MKEDYQKAFKKLTLFFLSNPVPFNGVTPKMTSANLCQSIHDIINYSTSICPFESGKCEKEEKKLQKIDYLQNEKSFLGDIKTFFTVFKELSIGGKIKI